MESILGYIIIAILIIVFVYFYNLRKKTSRVFTLSEQNYADAIFRVRVKKDKGSISSIILVLDNRNNLIINKIFVELITRNRELNNYDLGAEFENVSVPNTITANEGYNIELDFVEFKKLLSDGELPFRTFRFVIKTKEGNTYKSHELGFNKRWIIYRPDSGTYN